MRRDGHLAPPRGRDKRKFHATLERAIEIAAAAHAGQVDKAGQPYVLHPIRVMLRVTGSHARMAAILHDVVEDTPATIDQLVGEGFPAEVVAAVIALTKLPGESRLAAAARAAADPIAHAVKLADNAENMDLGRIAAPPSSRRKPRQRPRRRRICALFQRGLATPSEPQRLTAARKSGL